MSGDMGRFQIDYVLLKHRYKNGVNNCRAYPCMDVYSDHNPVVMNVNVKFKKIKKVHVMKKWNLEALKNEKYINEVEENITCNVETSEELWIHIKNTIIKSAQTNLEYAKKGAPQQMVDKMDGRREWKKVNSDEGRKNVQKVKQSLM